MATSMWARTLRPLRSTVSPRLNVCARPPHCRALSSPAFAHTQPSSRDAEEPADAKVEAKDPALEFASIKDRVHPSTLKAITVKPFTHKHMTPVQAAVLSRLPELAQPYDANTAAKGAARDLLVKARTGTGKTLAFLVPAIEARINAINEYAKQAAREAGQESDAHFEARAKRLFTREHAGTLIISPTRELATQIANEALRLSHHHEGFEVRLFVGGLSKRDQMREWMRGRRDIVVGTPGRLRDCLENEPEVTKGLSHTKLLILDEADTLMEMGFREEIKAITEYLPATPERQTFLFSATVSKSIQEIARATLDRKHTFIDCVPTDASPVHAHIPQYHTVLPSAGDQIPHVVRLLAHDQLSNPGKSKVIIFCPTTKMTQLMSTLLRELSKTCLPASRNTRVYEIHSQRSQSSRSITSDSFRNDKSGSSVLVSSDVSARGVDYPGVTRVIQIGIPGNTDSYVHRVGRTGRGDNVQGRADLVLLPWEIGFVAWQLSDIPLKPLTVKELTSQTAALAEKFDEDPKAFFPADSKFDTSSQRRGGPRQSAAGPRMFAAPLTPTLNNINEEVARLLVNVDEEAVRETMVSMLGYYIGKVTELRAQKTVIIQGCRDWSVEACGLPAPPYVSEEFLRRLGAGERGGRSRSGGKFGSSREQTSWTGRGRTSDNDYEPKKSFGAKSFGDDRRSSSRSGEDRYGSRDGGERNTRLGEERRSSNFGGERRNTSYGGERRGNGFGADRTFGGDRRNTRGSGDKNY